MRPVSFAIVGSGWRAMFYVRVAQRYPQWFKLCCLVCRSEEKAQRIRQEYGVRVVTDERVCEDAHPDFVVVAVDKASQFAVTRQWAAKGFAVLRETPAGTSEEELSALWALAQSGARIQVAEQYIRYPLMAAGLRGIGQGVLGDPYALDLSLAHDYHAASLIRHMLLCGGAFPAIKLQGWAYTFPVEETDSRYGPLTDGTVKERQRSRISIEFDNGKLAFYDFDGVQYHSLIRTRHINLRGQTGEWNDTTLRYVDAAHHPHVEQLRPWPDPVYEVLHTPELLELSQHWHPEVHMENWQDEYAIATLLLDMGAYLDGGREAYPLAEALEDAYTWLLMDRAIQNPGQAITSQVQPWHKG